MLQGPTGARASAVDVVDHGDGTYGCTFVAPAAGRWVMQAAVNGRVAKESTVEVIATYGPLRGVGLRDSSRTGTDGASDVRDDGRVYLQAARVRPRHRSRYGRTGGCDDAPHHPVGRVARSARRSPSAGRDIAPPCDGGSGAARIVATVSGEAVVGSPLVVEVDAQEVSLPMCRLSGQGLASAAAGESAPPSSSKRATRAKIDCSRAAPSSAWRCAWRGAHRGRVQDCGDGTYEASYVIEKAGPCEVSLFIGTEATSFRAVCIPGAWITPSVASRARFTVGGSRGTSCRSR